MKREFSYAGVERKIYLSGSARTAGEVAFGRPAGLDLAPPSAPSRGSKRRKSRRRTAAR
jgi:hypothetical protein